VHLSASLYPFFLSPDLPVLFLCVPHVLCISLSYWSACLVTVIHRLVSGGCFAIIDLAPTLADTLLPSVCLPLTLRMLCRQGCYDPLGRMLGYCCCWLTL
jgi:hypothetical protein